MPADSSPAANRKIEPIVGFAVQAVNMSPNGQRNLQESVSSIQEDYKDEDDANISSNLQQRQVYSNEVSQARVI